MNAIIQLNGSFYGFYGTKCMRRGKRVVTYTKESAIKATKPQDVDQFAYIRKGQVMTGDQVALIQESGGSVDKFKKFIGTKTVEGAELLNLNKLFNMMPFVSMHWSIDEYATATDSNNGTIELRVKPNWIRCIAELDTSYDPSKDNKVVSKKFKVESYKSFYDMIQDMKQFIRNITNFIETAFV